MSDSNSKCPTGFTLHHSPVRSCGRFGNDEATATTFLIEEPYSHVCGRITAIQKGTVNGFGPFNIHGYNRDHNYIDGISIKHGSTNQGHVWSFVAGAAEKHTNIFQTCPCANEQWDYHIPSFIGSDYFCETGNKGLSNMRSVFLNDPLWNGKGCVTGNRCCEFNNPPWFYRELPQTTNDNLKVILYLNNNYFNENIYVTEMELYVSP